jgi:chromosome segregation ATPase
MASQINGEASNQAKGQESAASNFRIFQQFIENLKLVTAAEDFQHVVDHLAEVDNLRQEVKVNRREMERLNSEVQTNKSNSKLAYQDVLDAQVESAKKMEEEKNDVRKQLDKVRKDLRTQQESNAEISKSKAQLEQENAILRNEKHSLTESSLQAQATIKELENQSSLQAQTISQLQETSRQQEIQLGLATKNNDALEEQKAFYRKRYDTSERSLQRLKELSYPLSPDSRDDV